MDLIIGETKKRGNNMHFNIKGCSIDIATIKVDVESNLIFINPQLHQWIIFIENRMMNLFPGRKIITRVGKSGYTFWPARSTIGGVTPNMIVVDASLSIIFDGISVSDSEIRYYVSIYGDVITNNKI